VGVANGTFLKLPKSSVIATRSGGTPVPVKVIVAPGPMFTGTTGNVPNHQNGVAGQTSPTLGPNPQKLSDQSGLNPNCPPPASGP
jgi:hypothetical protein